MTLRSEEAHAHSFWGFTWLLKALAVGENGTAAPAAGSDIDYCIERRGHLLFIETKPPGVGVPGGAGGQAGMFDTLTALRGTEDMHAAWTQANKYNALVALPATLLVLWGHKEKVEALLWWGDPFGPRPATNEEVIAQVRQWFAWATSHPRKLTRPARVQGPSEKRFWQ